MQTVLDGILRHLIVTGQLSVRWPDGHSTLYNLANLVRPRQGDIADATAFAAVVGMEASLQPAGDKSGAGFVPAI